MSVIYKFVPDATSRVAEIESGSSDLTLDIPFEEFEQAELLAGARHGLALDDDVLGQDARRRRGLDLVVTTDRAIGKGGLITGRQLTQQGRA